MSSVNVFNGSSAIETSQSRLLKLSIRCLENVKCCAVESGAESKVIGEFDGLFVLTVIARDTIKVTICAGPSWSFAAKSTPLKLPCRSAVFHCSNDRIGEFWRPSSDPNQAVRMECLNIKTDHFLTTIPAGKYSVEHIYKWRISGRFNQE